MPRRTPARRTVALLAFVALASCASGPEGGPTATITEPAGTAFVAPGDAVVFAGACASAPPLRWFAGADEPPPTHAWSFPGGSPSASAEGSPAPVVYASPGTFTATYVCTDALGRASHAATRLVVVTDPAAAAYRLDLELLTALTPPQAQAFLDAQALVQAVVTADVPDVDLRGASFAGCGDTAIGLVDDLLVFVRVFPIDGVGGILGQAAPCVVRSATGLPAVGIIELDTDDVRELERRGLLDAVVLHEMMHVLGFGTLWGLDPHFDLLAGAGSADPYFVGPEAREAFLAYDGGGTYAGNPVPVENTGGEGTRDGHWREEVFGDELMTGWISGRSQPVSRTTIMSLADLGYEVDGGAATLALAAKARGGEDEHGPLELPGDVRGGPLHEVDDEGVVRRRR